MNMVAKTGVALSRTVLDGKVDPMILGRRMESGNRQSVINGRDTVARRSGRRVSTQRIFSTYARFLRGAHERGQGVFGTTEKLQAIVAGMRGEKEELELRNDLLEEILSLESESGELWKKNHRILARFGEFYDDENNQRATGQRQRSSKGTRGEDQQPRSGNQQPRSAKKDKQSNCWTCRSGEHLKKLCPQRVLRADVNDSAHEGAKRSASPQRSTTRGNDGGPGKEPIQPTSGSESGPVPVPAQEGGSANDGGHEQDEHEFYADEPADERPTTSVQQEQPAAAEPVGHSRKEMAEAEHISQEQPELEEPGPQRLRVPERSPALPARPAAPPTQHGLVVVEPADHDQSRGVPPGRGPRLLKRGVSVLASMLSRKAAPPGAQEEPAAFAHVHQDEVEPERRGIEQPGSQTELGRAQFGGTRPPGFEAEEDGRTRRRGQTGEQLPLPQLDGDEEQREAQERATKFFEQERERMARESEQLARESEQLKREYERITHQMAQLGGYGVS